MKHSIAQDQKDFERWLLQETSVYARMAKRVDDGTSEQTDAGAQMTKWHYGCLLVVLGRYTDRRPELLAKVACDQAELLNAIRTGPSLLEQSEAQALAAAGGWDYRCRGCSGTCCTGLGSEPCTCPPPDSGDDD